MPIFAITYTYDHQSERRDEVRSEHRAFLRFLCDDGAVLASGPTGQGDGALVIVRAADDAAALQLLDSDPFMRDGLVASRVAAPWNPVIGPWAD